MSINAPSGLNRALFQKLTCGKRIERHQDLLVTGPTGTGKIWLSYALGHRACRDDRLILHQRVPRLLEADQRTIQPLTAEQRRGH